MTIPEKAVQWAIATAEDNSHGYSQADRWSPDYDCSSFVISAYEAAGVRVRNAGASYTGNMRGAFLACGFVDVTYECGLSSGYGIQAGDVLLNYSAHTCIAIGNGRVANCRTDEGHPQSGDQSGNEIRLQAYWNYPWNCILRYKGKEATTTPVDDALRYGSRGDAVKQLQQKLIELGYDVGKSGADGIYGYDTINAVRAFQKDNGLPQSTNANKATQDAIRAAQKTEEPKQEEPNGEPTEDNSWKYELLKKESKYNKSVVVLQALLNVRGFNCGNPDGYFGVLTEAAVNHAKRYYGLNRNGECDYALWVKLLLIER